MLHILIGRAKTGKSDRVLRRIRALGDGGRQILLMFSGSFRTFRCLGQRLGQSADPNF